MKYRFPKLHTWWRSAGGVSQLFLGKGIMMSILEQVGTVSCETHVVKKKMSELIGTCF